MAQGSNPEQPPAKPAQAGLQSFRFDSYLLHLGRYELSRGGKPLPLPRVPMEILILLVERRGHLVERRELAAAIWPGEDAEGTVQKINNAVNRLRGVLRDDPNKPRYIQTVIGKGYRFVAAVTVVADALPSTVRGREQAALPAEPPAVVYAAPPLSDAAGLLEQAGRVDVPATADQPGHVAARTGRAAAISPALPESMPASMPNGSHASRRGLLLGVVAFLGLLAVFAGLAYACKTRAPVLDCTEQECLGRTALTTNESQNSITAGALAPNGRLLAYSDADGIRMRSIDSSLTQPIAAPPLAEVDELTWFSDSLHLLLSGRAAPEASGKRAPAGAAAGQSGVVAQVWRLSLAGEPPLLLRTDAGQAAASPAGTEFAFTSADKAEVWVAGARGENARMLLPASPGTTYPVLLWSADGTHLLLARRSLEQAVQTYLDRPFGLVQTPSYMAIDAHTGAVTASAPGVRFRYATLLSGGRLLLARPEPFDEGSISTRLLEARLDPATGALLSTPQPVSFLRDHQVLDLSTPDDRSQVVALIRHGQSDIYLGDVSAGQGGMQLEGVRPLTADKNVAYPHAWTPDSQALLFESRRGGSMWNLYRLALHQHDAEPVAPSNSDQVLAQVTPVGRSILFADRTPPGPGHPYTIVRVPLGGGVPQAVFRESEDDEFKCPQAGDTCVLRQAPGHQRFVYYAFDPISGKGAELAQTPWAASNLGRWALSPDNRTVAVPTTDPASSALWLTSLGRPGLAQPSRELPLDVVGQILALHWTASGKGWFLTTLTGADTDLDFIDQDGRSTLLRRLTGRSWVIPSPDGKRIAFLDQTLDSNFWRFGQ